jgi:hypothetical protein
MEVLGVRGVSSAVKRFDRDDGVWGKAREFFTGDLEPAADVRGKGIADT